MTYRGIDESIASTANPGMIHAYLRSLGWFRQAGSRPEIAIYVAPDDRLAQALLPLDDATPDYAARIIDAIWAVAEATRTDVQTVLGRFLGIHAEPARRNLILCFDGGDLRMNTTNVRRFWRALERDPLQVRYYSSAELFGGAAVSTSFGRRIAMSRATLHTHRAIREDVVNAYRFLIRNHHPADRIYLIGFGLGGYAARVLAGLVHLVGLFEKGAEDAAALAVSQYLVTSGWRPDVELQELKVLRSDFGRPVEIEFMGVWDSIRPYATFGQLRGLPYTALNPSVRHVRHAIAIDERRSMRAVDHFRRADDDHDLKEVWFAGVHSDVGGGYPEQESGLAKISLRWMANQAEGVGLRFNEARLNSILGGEKHFAPPDSLGPLHNSMVGAWRLMEWIPRRVFDHAGHARWRVHGMRLRSISDGTLVHESVLQRTLRVAGYRPTNLRSQLPVERDEAERRTARRAMPDRRPPAT